MQRCAHCAADEPFPPNDQMAFFYGDDPDEPIDETTWTLCNPCATVFQNEWLGKRVEPHGPVPLDKRETCAHCGGVVDTSVDGYAQVMSEAPFVDDLGMGECADDMLCATCVPLLREWMKEDVGT